MTEINEIIRTALKEKKLILGRDRTLKLLKQGKLEAVYFASNANAEDKDEAAHYGKLLNVQVLDSGLPNDELRLICKKPFSIALLGILKVQKS